MQTRPCSDLHGPTLTKIDWVPVNVPGFQFWKARFDGPPIPGRARSIPLTWKPVREALNAQEWPLCARSPSGNRIVEPILAVSD